MGCGHIAWEYDGGAWDLVKSLTHSSCFDRHPSTELVAMFEPNPDNLVKIVSEHPNGSNIIVTDDQALFLNSGLDVVSIASPPAFHEHLIIACIEAKIPYIWIEKPVTLDMKSFNRVRQALDRSSYDLRISVNFFRRFLPQYQFLKDKIDNKIPIKSIEFDYSRKLDVNGVHLLDILSFLFPNEPPPKIDWFTSYANGNPSFGFNLADVEISFIGHDVAFHTIDIKITTEVGRYSVIRGGLNVIEEKCIPNPNYSGFYQLSKPKDVTNNIIGAANLDDGTYLSLCNLLDQNATSISTIETAYFSQAVLEQVTVHFAEL